MNTIKIKFFQNIAGAWIFYTTFPRIPFIKPRFENIAQFSPLIGLIIGCIQSLILNFFVHISWPLIASISISISSGYLITGGLHLDGLMDTFDGLYAGKKRMLKAMKDSRVGSFGVIAFTLIFLIQFASLIKLNSQIVYFLPICLFWGRYSTLVYINNYKYINKKSKSISHKKDWRGIWAESLVPISSLIIFLLMISSAINTYKNLLLLSIGILISILIPTLMGKRIKGFNGDSLGANLVIVETIMIFVHSLIL